MEKVLINIAFALIVIIGFFWYWGKSSGIFKEGGFVNKWWKNYRSQKKDSKNKLTKK